MLQFSQQRLASEVADRLVGMAVKLHGREPQHLGHPTQRSRHCVGEGQERPSLAEEDSHNSQALNWGFPSLVSKKIKKNKKFILNSFNIVMFLYYKILRTFFY